MLALIISIRELANHVPHLQCSTLCIYVAILKADSLDLGLQAWMSKVHNNAHLCYLGPYATTCTSRLDEGEWERHISLRFSDLLSIAGKP